MTCYSTKMTESITSVTRQWNLILALSYVGKKYLNVSMITPAGQNFDHPAQFRAIWHHYLLHFHTKLILKEGQRKRLLLTRRYVIFRWYSKMLMVFYHFIFLNPQAQWNFCRSCVSWVMLQILSKQKFFIKRPLDYHK